MAWLFSRGLWQISFSLSLFCRFGRKPVSTILVFPSMGGCLFHSHGSLRIQLPSPGDLGVSGYSIPRHTSSWFCFAGFSIPSICFSLVAPSFLMCLDSVSPCRFLVSFRVVCVFNALVLGLLSKVCVLRVWLLWAVQSVGYLGFLGFGHGS